MEFWGVEVKAGEPLKVTPNPGTIIHLSQAALGETKKDKGSESVLLSVKIGGSKIVLGTLSGEKFPQLSFDVVFEKEVELSHNWKNGSVYLCGYQTPMQDDNDDMFDSEEEDDDLPLMNANNGKVEAKVENVKPAVVSAKPKPTFVEPSKAAKADDDDSDEDDDSEDDSDDDDDESGEDDSEEGMSVDEDDEDKDEDEETPKKGKKRVNDSGKKTPVPSKKAKADTPQKTDGKKGVHTATPHPAKNAQKNPANGNKQTPKSGGQFSCKPCNKSFASDNALQSHNKAKHSGGK